jgi:hypothetical protein
MGQRGVCVLVRSSRQLNGEPDDKGHHDDEHQDAHCGCGSSIDGSTPRPPFVPPAFRVSVQNGRSWSGHWRASRMLCDKVRPG